MPDFGIGEILAGLAAAAPAAEAVAPAAIGAGEAAAGGAGLASSAELASMAAAAGLDVAPAGLAPAATSITVNPLIGAAAGGAGAGEALGGLGLGGLGAGIGDILAPSANAAVSPGGTAGLPMGGNAPADFGARFDAVSPMTQGGAPAVGQPAGGAGGGAGGAVAATPGASGVDLPISDPFASLAFSPPSSAAAAPSLPDAAGASAAIEGAFPGGGPAAAFAPPSPGVTDPTTALGGGGSLDDMSAAASVAQSGNTPLDLSAPAQTAAKTAAGGGGLMDFAKNNPGLLAALGIGGLGTIFGGKLASKLAPKLPNESNLLGVANTAQAQNQEQLALERSLTDPLLSGNLPAGAQSQYENAKNDALNTIRGRYAKLGMTGSSAEADALAYATSQSEGLKFQIAQQMAQTGLQAGQQAVSDLGIQDQVYSQLMQAQISQDTALQNSISSFASAAALATGLASRARA